MRYLLITVMLLLTQVSFAETYPVDLSKCKSETCFSLKIEGMYEPGYQLNEKVRVASWFDVVRFEKNENLKIYPLFNVFNKSDHPINVQIGMEFLDQNKEVVVSRISDVTVDTYKGSDEWSTETYKSLNAVKISDAQIESVSYLKVVYAIK